MTAFLQQTPALAPAAPGVTPLMERCHQARIVIAGVQPQLDGGRYPLKRIVGDTLDVKADIFRDGHDLLVAVLKYRPQTRIDWTEVPLKSLNPGLDLWGASFVLDQVATWTYTIEAWVDVFGSWRVELQKKADAGQDVASELLEGVRLILETAERLADDAPRPGEFLTFAAERISKATNQAEAVRLALDAELAAVMHHHPDRTTATRLDRELQVVVDRPRAQFAAWYEFFPRSQTHPPEPPLPKGGTIKSGTFQDCIGRLPAVKALGFDVVYLPPIHPIGTAHRKGKNNALVAGPNDPGSPWGIGSSAGGHMSVEPSLGTLADFDAFVAAAQKLDIDVALDFAIQCSPDHPWGKQHPEWFYHRPDGTIKYAENPPKKYQDIYPVNFDNEAWASLWEEMRTVLRFWISHGVKTFRVDNPHTKPIHFWEWLIGVIKREHPDVLFLAEAFTRPKVMKTLAKAGFTQSYTYFTWRNAKAELTEYLTELTQTEMADYYRGNLFANTPDILNEYLQHGGRPAFKIRALLAATLSSVYGIYSGFELCENVPVKPGSEEYLDSEKYQLKPRDWNAPGNLNDYLTMLNRTRREQPALQEYKNLRFHPCDNEQIICYSKATRDFGNAVIAIVNLDPHRWQEGYVRLDLAELGLGADPWYQVHDQVTGAVWHWRGAHNYVRLEPQQEPGHLLVVRR